MSQPPAVGAESMPGPDSELVADSVPDADRGRVAAELTDDAVAALLPERPPRAHKGRFGRLLVVAGSLDFAGAGLLTCLAAGRAGAGLVTLAVAASLQPVFAGRVLETMTVPLPERDGDAAPEAASLLVDRPHDALVVGPGLRRSPGFDALALGILTAGGMPPAAGTPAAPAVVDAEALRVLAATSAWWTALRRPCVLTPHAGEFARLRAGEGDDAAADGDLVADDDARAAATLAAADRWGQVVVLKGARTVIAGPDGTCVVAPFENPALASGGTGDVLAGTIGALLAQGLSPFDAAAAGVYLHGAAAEALRGRFGAAGMLASDLPLEIAGVRQRLAGRRGETDGARRVGFGISTPAAAASRPSVDDAGRRATS